MDTRFVIATSGSGSWRRDSRGRLFEKLDSGVAHRPLSGQQLPAADEQYVDFYDHAPDLLFSIDARNGRVLYCNQTACTALGYSKEEIVGSTIFDFYRADSRPLARRAFHSFQRISIWHRETAN